LHDGPLWPWYACLFAAATARAFLTPSGVAFYPTLMPESMVANAVPWNSANFQIGAVAGPILGGLLFAWKGSQAAFAAAALGFVIYFACLALIKPLRPFKAKPRRHSMGQLLTQGLGFIYSEKLILAPISLDLFAVLFGGVEALLPIFAKDILGVGAVGLGFLRAAPFLGAFVMGLFIAHQPMTKAGRNMLLAVAGFGLCMITFGLSRNIWLSLAALAVSGALDAISVVVRQTIVQLRTPQAMLGRVQAVNFLFIGSSNELGEFESGMTAAAFGPVGSVIGGGLLTLLVVLAASRIWPELKNLGKLEDVKSA
jgi:MFS family permease